jgi:cell division transport system permease protein
MLSITSIAFSLFAFGLFALVAVNIRKALERVEERVEIRAFAPPGASVNRLLAAADSIGRFPEVARVDVVTSEQALERARAELGEFRDVFEASFLPASLDIRIRPGFREPASVESVARRIGEFDIVDDVRFGQEWIVQLHRLRNVAGVVGLALGLSFAAVALIIIGTTIRMAVLARASEIALMRLVGATPGYIRRPFLVEGVVKGLLGGTLALVLTWGAMRLVEGYLEMDTVFFDIRMLGAGLLFGAVLGFVGSAVSVGRQLRSI